jgi:hypothetical protein
MMTDEAVQTWELAFSGPPRLEFRGESGDVVLRAAAPGEPCRLELSGPRAEKVTVHVRTGGSRVGVNAESRGDPSRGGAVFTFTVPRDLHASIASDFGGITAEGLGPCDLDLSTDLGSLRLRRMMWIHSTSRPARRQTARRVKAASLPATRVSSPQAVRAR